LKISSRSIAQNMVCAFNQCQTIYSLPCRAIKSTLQRLVVNSCVLSVSLSCPQGLVVPRYKYARLQFSDIENLVDFSTYEAWSSVTTTQA
jgi:hypothetical protein